MTEKKLLSFIVPVLNEEANVEPLYEALTSAIAPLLGRYEYEIIFTDNHSIDASFEILMQLATTDPRVRVVRFSRNFGFQRSILTGYQRARGDAVVQIDCDLQDPPALIKDFVALWEEGSQVVYGVRRGRKESWALRSSRKAFYRLIDFLSEDDLPHDAGDFRLVDRVVVDEISRIDDYQPYLRGAIAAMGFNQTGIEYDRGDRLEGKSKFSLGKLAALAIDGILNHSVVPLRIATYTGLLVSFLTFLGLVAYAVAKIFFDQSWPAGFATTTGLILASLSLNALFLGIIGEYLGRIYQQVKKRPVTIVEREINFSHPGVPVDEQAETEQLHRQD